jgi:hypothetical protein
MTRSPGARGMTSHPEVRTGGGQPRCSADGPLDQIQSGAPPAQDAHQGALPGVPQRGGRAAARPTARPSVLSPSNPGAPISTSRATRSGWTSATHRATKQLPEWPTSVARSSPAARSRRGRADPARRRGSARGAGQDPAEGEPRVGRGGQNDDRFSVRVALLGIVDPRTAGKAHGGKPKLRNLLPHGRPSGTPTLHTVPIYGGEGQADP